MTRALAPVVGVIALVGCTIVMAATVGVAMTGVPSVDTPPRVTVTVSADAEAGRIVLSHDGGDPIDVQTLDILVEVDGMSLMHQPPVPFFSATGFMPGPTGPFNSASDPSWTVGESASFQVAGTNTPTIAPGSQVDVQLLVDGSPVTEASTTA